MIFVTNERWLEKSAIPRLLASQVNDRPNTWQIYRIKPGGQASANFRSAGTQARATLERCFEELTLM